MGAGATGLAAGMESGFPVFEASETPGGICSSYYVSRDGETISSRRRADEDDYRFEIGGGHWIFGGDDETIGFMDSLAPLRSYERRSSVWFPETQTTVPFPIQFHLSHLPGPMKAKAFEEILSAGNGGGVTLKEHVTTRFGSTLTDLFFGPFHKAYTAGLYEKIVPQDEYKSPLDIELVRRGYSGEDIAAGYNVKFKYPTMGLGTLFQRMARKCDIRYAHRVVKIDVKTREIHLSSGESHPFDSIISSLPLSTMATLTGLGTVAEADPHTSVLVVNIGGKRGFQCPSDHWVYVPSARSGVYRIGFYSNVDKDFLPTSIRKRGECVSIYAESAFTADSVLSDSERVAIAQRVVEELIAWRFLEQAEVVHPTWIDVAYTWRMPGSRWKERLLEALESCAIHQTGRYARWQFQGIAESIREGRKAGKRMRELVG